MIRHNRGSGIGIEGGHPKIATTRRERAHEESSKNDAVDVCDSIVVIAQKAQGATLVPFKLNGTSRLRTMDLPSIALWRFSCVQIHPGPYYRLPQMSILISWKPSLTVVTDPRIED
jgi:hypothetical protein